MLSTVILSCGIVWNLLFGCSAEDHVPATNTIIQTQQMHEQTEQQRIQSQQQVEQQRIQAGLERAAIHATSVAYNAQLRADVERFTQDAVTQRNLQMQVHASERLHAEERARTERQSNMMMLFASMVITGGIVATVWVLKEGGTHVSPDRDSDNEDDHPFDLPRASPRRFKEAADGHGWDGWQVVTDGSRMIGEDHNGKQWLLED